MLTRHFRVIVRPSWVNPIHLLVDSTAIHPFRVLTSVSACELIRGVISEINRESTHSAQNEPVVNIVADSNDSDHESINSNQNEPMVKDIASIQADTNVSMDFCQNSSAIDHSEDLQPNSFVDKSSILVTRPVFIEMMRQRYFAKI